MRSPTEVRRQKSEGRMQKSGRSEFYHQDTKTPSEFGGERTTLGVENGL